MDKYNELREKAKEIRSKFNGSDDMASDYLFNCIEQNNYKLNTITDDELRDCVHEACCHIMDGNAEPEYEDEDFYCEEPVEQRVFEYAKIYIQMKLIEQQ